MATQHLSPKDITLSDRLQMRESMNEGVIEQYAENLDAMPPCEIIRDDDGTNWLVDGFHTFEAHKKKGSKSIPCNITKGTMRDALVAAAGANTQHGLPLTIADRRKKVGMILKEPDFTDLSSRGIAEICRVSHTFVDSVRSTGNTASSNGQAKPARKRKGKDGKTRTSQPRKAKQPKPPKLCRRCKRIGSASCEKCRKAAQEYHDAKERTTRPAKEKDTLDFVAVPFDEMREGLAAVLGGAESALKMLEEEKCTENNKVKAAVYEAQAAVDAWHKRASREEERKHHRAKAGMK